MGDVVLYINRWYFIKESVQGDVSTSGLAGGDEVKNVLQRVVG